MSQQAASKSSLPEPKRCSHSSSLALEWESCSHGALEVIVPRSYTPFEPPPFCCLTKENTLSPSPPSVLSLSLVQRFVTPAPDCGLLKSLEVVSGSHLPLSLLCGLGGVWGRWGGGGTQRTEVLQELEGVVKGGVSKGRRVSSDLNESITSCQRQMRKYPSAPPVHLR